MAMKNKGKIKKPVMPSREKIVLVNDNAAGVVYNEVIAKSNKIEYTSKDVYLADIRLNPDNEIFRAIDTEEDIIMLAEDIQRNGLMHNLVVFPQDENGKTVYVLLSGERRYKAMKYLESKGNALWNVVKNCNVITTGLSANERKVLLYSANLQVRGGFGDEMIRRKAAAEFIECLQKEPYNLDEKAAKKALKNISPVSDRMLEKDIRLENTLNKGLLEFLDKKLLTRAECENYNNYEPEQQQCFLTLFNDLFAIDCHSSNDGTKNTLEEIRDDIHTDAQKALLDVWNGKSTDERDQKLEKALADFSTGIELLKQEEKRYTAALEEKSKKATEEIETAAAVEREEKQTKEKTAPQKAAPKTFVQKTLQPIAEKIHKKIDTEFYKQGLNNLTQEQREEDMATLNGLVDEINKLKALIEATE